MSSYAAYDDLRRSETATFTALVSSDSDHVGRNLHSVNDNGETLILCHVPAFFRWTQVVSDGSPADVSAEAYGGSAAALLAMHHFNTGNGSIVDDLQGIHQRCPIRLTTELYDSQSSGSVAMKALTRLVTRDPTTVTEPQPCALVGSSWSSVTKQMATVTGVYDLPQVTSSASSVDLDNAAEYPLFGRTHPSDASMAQLSIEYLFKVLNVSFLGVLRIDNAFGNSYNQHILDYAASYNMTVRTESFRADASNDEIRGLLQRLAKSGFSYFLGVFFAADYQRIMEIAQELGVAGPGRFWMFNGALSSSFVNGETVLPSNSLAAKATFGNAIIHDEGGLPGVSETYDRFLQHWQAIGNDRVLLDYINSKQPTPPSAAIDFNRTPDFFQTEYPSHIASFSYDAVVGLGLSACLALANQSAAASLDNDGTNEIFSGSLHHEHFVENTFAGATGNVTIGPDTFSRQAESTFHVVSNILQTGESNNGDSVFRALPSTVFDTQNQTFVPYSQEPFVYSDGTTTPPMELPPLTENNNNVTTAVRALCLLLCGIAMGLSIGFFLFSWIMRNHRVIRASQPIFLLMICVGTLLMGSTIIPASADDSVASERGCDVACVFMVWLFPIGFCTTFSALFSKLWRINRLFKHATGFKRVQVRPRDVIVPYLILLGLNVVVLITLTVMFPPQWTREIIAYDSYGRPIESLGSCSSERFLDFLIPLLIINGVALVLALWQAYVARNITTEFSESKYIAMATVCIFQALFIGVPILFIVDGQPTASLFIVSGIILIICMSVLLLIFVPKVMAVRRNESQGTRSSVRRSSVSSSVYGGSHVISSHVEGAGDRSSSMVDPFSSENSVANVEKKSIVRTCQEATELKGQQQVSDHRKSWTNDDGTGDNV